MVVDATGFIRYVENEFMGYLNDAQTFGLMRRIGTELCFPEQCILLGDKIYPIGNCIMTPYTFYLFLFIQCFKRVTRLAVIAILPCGPLCKHIYIYTSNIFTSWKTKRTS